MCETYNGHTNYASWNVGLWIDNDQFLSLEVQDLAHECFLRGKSVYQFAEALKELISGMMPELNESSMVADLLGWAVDMVDWDELAEGYYEEEKANGETATAENED